MRLSASLSLLTALVFAALAGYFAMGWLEQQRQVARPVIVEPKPKARTIVVAAERLRWGMELTKQNLREIAWHASELPRGAFSKISDVLASDKKRFALSSLEPNELVLESKITGPGQRASLAALLSPGKKAVTIRVNDVNGIAGFVLPGDRVDVLLTRKSDKQTSTEVMLQGVRVLGVDQIADERTDKKAVVVKSVTLEVRTEDAQRVVLASTIGNLALALRSPAVDDREPTSRMTPATLIDGAVRPDVSASTARLPSTQTIAVVRAVKRTEYAVPSRTALADPRPERVTGPADPVRPAEPAMTPAQPSPAFVGATPVSAIRGKSRVN